ncbi:MAG: hypothetical protein HOV80_35630, partial [Polyangiaceae bacterium]|nr:hypothetical protein [Polyangiaceae bacterium]
IIALLRAQTIEGRLERAALQAPDVPFDAIDRYVSKSLLPWMLETLSFLEELDRAAPSSGAGRAIVTLARGRALLRLATVARGAVDQKPACDRRTRGPAPFCPLQVKPARASWPYLSNLGDELEQKGHGALRQGLRELAESGVIDDGRGHEAAARIANQRKGSGPPPLTEVISASPPAEIAGLTGRLARALPVPRVPAFLAPDGSADITVMQALSARGLPAAWAAPPESLSRELALSAGRARLALALRYQRRADVESAVAYAQSVDATTLGPDDRAWMATAVGLRAAMGGEAPPDGPLAPLAVVAASEGEAASLARFNLEVLAVNARRRARQPFSPESCRMAWDAVRKTGASLEQRAWVDWCVHASDAWAAVPRPALCGSP